MLLTEMIAGPGVMMAEISSRHTRTNANLTTDTTSHVQ